MMNIRVPTSQRAGATAVLMLVLWLLAAVASTPSQAQEAAPAAVVVEGQRFAGRVSVQEAELVLNGTGVRAAAWFKAYAAGLYLRETTRSAEQAVAMAGPKRLQLRLLHEVPAVELSKAVRKGVMRNSSDAERRTLEAQLQRFEALIQTVDKVRKGDVVDLDQDNHGRLRFSLNGTLRGGPEAASALYPALLRSFVGAKPYDDALKAGLLGAKP